MDHQQSNDVVPSRTQLVTRARERRYDATTRFFCPERECERATRPFDRYNNLKQHFVSTHCAPEFICGRCDKMFASSTKRSRHQAACGLVYLCSHCQHEYATRETFQRHTRRTRTCRKAQAVLQPPHASQAQAVGVGHASQVQAVGVGHASQVQAVGVGHASQVQAVGVGHASQAQAVGVGHAAQVQAVGVGHASQVQAALQPRQASCPYSLHAHHTDDATQTSALSHLTLVLEQQTPLLPCSVSSAGTQVDIAHESASAFSLAISTETQTLRVPVGSRGVQTSLTQASSLVPSSKPGQSVNSISTQTAYFPSASAASYHSSSSSSTQTPSLSSSTFYQDTTTLEARDVCWAVTQTESPLCVDIFTQTLDIDLNELERLFSITPT